MTIFSKEQIISLHAQLIEETGGVGGLRDEGLLDSAMSAPFQAFGNVEPFPSIQQKAARLGYGLIMNHPFIDGNKRIGAHVMLVFLALNGIELEYTQDELASEILSVASGDSGFERLLQWIFGHQS